MTPPRYFQICGDMWSSGAFSLLLLLAGSLLTLSHPLGFEDLVKCSFHHNDNYHHHHQHNRPFKIIIHHCQYLHSLPASFRHNDDGGNLSKSSSNFHLFPSPMSLLMLGVIAKYGTSWSNSFKEANFQFRPCDNTD